MMYSRKYRNLSGMTGMLLMLLLAAGCIFDDLSGCFRGLDLRVALHGSVPGGEESVRDVRLYIFDDKDLLLDIVPVSISQTVRLDYRGVPRLRCVAWCNTGDGGIRVSPLTVGDAFSRGTVSLEPLVATRSDGTTYVSPPDLFYGELEIENTMASGSSAEHKITVSRMVASMNITVRGLELLAGTSAGVFSLNVQGTPDRIDFGGIYGGESASYAPAGAFDAKRDYVVPEFRLFPASEGKGLTIGIFHDGELLRSVTAGSDGLPIAPVAGKTLHVLINLESGVDVEMVVTGWGENHIWKEYN